MKLDTQIMHTQIMITLHELYFQGQVQTTKQNGIALQTFIDHS